MELKDGCLMIMPPVYEIQLGLGRRWCKIGDVCDVASGLREITRTNFDPSPEDLVSRFAALIRPNALEIDDGPAKKFFRYSIDGKSMWGTEVPQTKPMPPYIDFRLSIDGAYPRNLFVPEDWVKATLNAVRQGAVAAADFGKWVIGFPDTNRGPLITLDGESGMALVRVPAYLRLE